MIRGESDAEEAAVQVRLGTDLLDRLVQHLFDVLTGTTGVAVSVHLDGEPPTLVSAVGSAEELDTLQWRLGDGPLLDARRTERPVISADLAADDQWPGLSKVLRRSPSHDLTGAIVLPGSWDDGGPVLISVYLKHSPTDADVEQVARLEPLLSTALAFVQFCSGEVLRADQMLQMMQYRRVIEQAKGLVIAALNCDSNQAFDTLTRASQHFNVRLRDLAIALVEHVGDGPAEQPEDPTSIVQPTPRTRDVGELVWSAIRHGNIAPDRRPKA